MNMAAHSQFEPIRAEVAHALSDRVRDTLVQDWEQAERDRVARVRAVRGKYAHIPTSSDAFTRKKQEEIAREDRRS